MAAHSGRRGDTAHSQQPEGVGQGRGGSGEARRVWVRRTRCKRYHPICSSRDPARGVRLPPVGQARFWTQVEIRPLELVRHAQDHHGPTDVCGWASLWSIGQWFSFTTVAAGAASHCNQRTGIRRHHVGSRRRRQRCPRVLAGHPAPAPLVRRITRRDLVRLLQPNT
jgi:hypothetical protein